MQLGFNSSASSAAAAAQLKPQNVIRLSDLRQGQSAVIDAIDLPQEFAHRLMELGFVPGATVEAARSAPGGDPRVFRIDGTEVALRRETAERLTVRP